MKIEISISQLLAALSSVEPLRIPEVDSEGDENGWVLTPEGRKKVGEITEFIVSQKNDADKLKAALMYIKSVPLEESTRDTEWVML